MISRNAGSRHFVQFLAAFLLILILVWGLGQDRPARAQEGDLPEKAFVEGVVGHPQSMNLSCESRSAADWAAFWGVKVTEREFFDRLPVSANPDLGFVGSPYGAWGYVPPNPYGVHAGPVAANLRSFGLIAEARSGMSWDELRAEVAAGRPVIVWLIGRVWPGKAIPYTGPEGGRTIVAPFEHTMILIGYDSRRVQLVDASNGWTGTFSIDSFLESWAVLGNMAVLGRGQTPAGWQFYSVKEGDYLVRLAERSGTTWQELVRQNGLRFPYVIYSGQVLLLPEAEAESIAPVPGLPAVIPTQTASPDPTPTPEPTRMPDPPAGGSADGGYLNYSVVRGDYLALIARRQGLDWQEIARINNLVPPYTLYAGQVLKLPVPLPPQGSSLPPAPVSSPAETHTVAAGEYLLDIASRYGLNWQELVWLNGLAYPYVVLPGQEIRLR